MTASPEQAPDPAWSGTRVRPVSDAEFRLFQALIHREAGIHLAPAKRALLMGRLSKRLRELGLSSYGAYYRLVAQQGGAELTRLLDAITTNESHFFRVPGHFELIAQRLVPFWRREADEQRRPRRILAWSAGCATGEEAYSLAMLLRSYLDPGEGWRVEVLGTDLSTRALAQAEAGVWPAHKAREIPRHLLKRHMLRGTGTKAHLMKADAGLRGLVRFRQVNLHRPPYPVPRDFDLIFCCNVLIYFKPEDRMRIVLRLLEHLAPEGCLFLGHAETLHGLGDRLHRIGPSVYTHAASRLALRGWRH